MAKSRADKKADEQLRGVKETVKYLDEHSMEYVLALLEIAQDVDTQPSVKVKIYQELLNKSIPNKQHLEIEDSTPIIDLSDLENMTEQELDALKERIRDEACRKK